ncbi:hypothetical protein DNTS_033191 [Danionella cerebrum]|uniref:LRRCT domain-containing protein n=1 Tax=Danionella cerebrum TaxID=2873325 RepID=A0A553NKU4_9TELE|nr:hypothetical protein DNTS_033191 [Danionella translucida]
MRDLIFALSLLPFLQSVSSCPKECSCDAHSNLVDCHGRGLYDIPRKLPQEALELHLHDNRLRSLGSTSFRDTPHLQALNLANNSITVLSPSAFLGLRHLRVLNLANNSIRELDRRLLVSVRNITVLDLSFNSLSGLPGAFSESFHHLTHLSLHHNRLTKVDRVHLEALDNLQVLDLKANPWRCDCHLIGLKLWLETFTFRGGVLDSAVCVQPPLLQDRDLRLIPYELFHSCMITSYSYLFANIHYLDSKHRSFLSGPALPSPHPHLTEPILPECEPKPRPRPANYRHAMATVVITGVVCGIVCLMMLAAAVYGCAYAAINAKYQRELKMKEKEAGGGEGQKNIQEDEKEPLEG